MKFGRVPENQARIWFQQMTSALRYLHSMGIAHRDLKCENVLISANYNMKITDFGFGTLDAKDHLSDTFCGSAPYASPEIVNGIPYDPTKADVWSLGIILSVILYGQLPFSDNEVSLIRVAQKDGRMNQDPHITMTLSKECLDALKMCLIYYPEKRPDIEKVYNCKWIQDRVKAKMMKKNNQK